MNKRIGEPEGTKEENKAIEEFQNNIDLKMLEINGRANAENNKTTSQEKIKIAELENQLLLAEQKKTETSK